MSHFIDFIPWILGIVNIAFTGWVTYRFNRKTTYINTVTSERVKWIGKVRENISEYCGAINQWYDLRLKKEEIRRIDILRTNIKLQLNPEGKIEKKIIELLDKTWGLPPKELMEAIKELTEQTQLLLKNEWEVVKKESRYRPGLKKS